MPQNKIAAATSDFGDVDQPDVIDLNKVIAAELAETSVVGYLPIGNVPMDTVWGIQLREFLVTIESINASYGSALAVLEKSTAEENRARDLGDDHARIAHICAKVGGMSVIIKNLLLEKDLLLGSLKLLFNEMTALDLLQREHPDLVKEYHEKINRSENESKKVLSSIEKISRLVEGIDAFGAIVEPKQRDMLLAHSSAIDHLTAENITEQALRAQQGAKMREIIGFGQQAQNASGEVSPDIRTADDIARQNALAETAINEDDSGQEDENSDEEDGGEADEEEQNDPAALPEEITPKESEEEPETRTSINDMIDAVLTPKTKNKKEGKK